MQIVPSGAVLIAQGAPADALFLVLVGRFRVTRDGETIATIGAGEPIGELAFFSGGIRTATVAALRESEVLRLDRAEYEALAAENPALPHAILQAVSARLAALTPRAPALPPASGLVVALRPAGTEPLPEAFVEGVRAAVARHGAVTLHDETAAPAAADVAALADWFRPLERDGRRHVLLVRDARAHPAWAAFADARSDSRYLVAELAASPASAPAPVEAEAGLAGRPRDHLLLWRPSARTPITGTAGWLARRALALHHHLGLDSPGDFDRLMRFVTDRARGLVLGGGGAFGTAHIGAWKAMSEAGIAVDFLGGTSVGAAMAAALAQGLDPEDIMRRCEEIFVTSRAMNRLAVPLYSALDHRVFDEQLARHYGEGGIEDLPVGFFALSTNLSRNDAHLHRSGPLWRAVRASGSIPALLPPVLTEEGEVLIDGGLLDNLPLTAMRRLKSGPNLAFDFRPRQIWRVEADYDRLPGRLGALLGLLFPRSRRGNRFPRIPNVLARAMTLNSRRRSGRMELGEDVLVNLPITAGARFLDWKRGQQHYAAAHRALGEAIGRPDPAEDAMDVMRAAALRLNGGGRPTE